MTKNNETQIAVFIDAENILSWLIAGYLAILMAELHNLGRTIIRKAYGNWSNLSLAKHQALLNVNGFELIQTFHPVKGKNSADIKMTVDAMDIVNNPEIDCIVLATGDSDFSPLFRMLREKGKEVIGIGPRSHLSECVQNSCSRYIYTDVNNPVSQSSPSITKISDSVEAFSNLEQILKQQNGPVVLSLLKLKMLEIDKTFNEKSFGYNSFREFVLASNLATLTKTCTDIFAEYVHASDPVPPLIGEKAIAVKALKSKGWGIAPRGTVEAIYNFATKTQFSKDQSRRELLDAIVANVGGGITLTTATKVLNMFLRSKMVHTTNNGSESTFTIIPNDDYLKIIDQAMLVRLNAGLVEMNHMVDKESVNELLLGDYSPEEAQKVIDSALIYPPF